MKTFLAAMFALIVVSVNARAQVNDPTKFDEDRSSTGTSFSSLLNTYHLNGGGLPAFDLSRSGDEDSNALDNDNLTNGQRACISSYLSGLSDRDNLAMMRDLTVTSVSLVVADNQNANVKDDDYHYYVEFSRNQIGEVNVMGHWFSLADAFRYDENSGQMIGEIYNVGRSDSGKTMNDISLYSSGDSPLEALPTSFQTKTLVGFIPAGWVQLSYDDSDAQGNSIQCDHIYYLNGSGKNPSAREAYKTCDKTAPDPAGVAKTELAKFHFPAGTVPSIKYFNVDDTRGYLFGTTGNLFRYHTERNMLAMEVIDTRGTCYSQDPRGDIARSLRGEKVKDLQYQQDSHARKRYQ